MLTRRYSNVRHNLRWCGGSLPSVSPILNMENSTLTKMYSQRHGMIIDRVSFLFTARARISLWQSNDFPMMGGGDRMYNRSILSGCLGLSDSCGFFNILDCGSFSFSFCAKRKRQVNSGLCYLLSPQFTVPLKSLVIGQTCQEQP